jgi:hypothetical protein
VAVKPGRGSDLNKEANSNPALCGSAVRRISDPEDVYLLACAKHLLSCAKHLFVMTELEREEEEEGAKVPRWWMFCQASAWLFCHPAYFGPPFPTGTLYDPDCYLLCPS